MNGSQHIDSYSRQFVLVNENKVRLTALGVLIIVIIFLFSQHWIFPALLVADFAIRSFSTGEYSILNILSDNMVSIFNINIKPVDYAPRQFAARIGLVLSIIVLITSLLKIPEAIFVSGAILAVVALIESVLRFCTGCYIYKWYKKQPGTAGKK